MSIAWGLNSLANNELDKAKRRDIAEIEEMKAQNLARFKSDLGREDMLWKGEQAGKWESVNGTGILQNALGDTLDTRKKGSGSSKFGDLNDIQKEIMDGMNNEIESLDEACLEGDNAACQNAMAARNNRTSTLHYWTTGKKPESTSITGEAGDGGNFFDNLVLDDLPTGTVDVGVDTPPAQGASAAQSAKPAQSAGPATSGGTNDASNSPAARSAEHIREWIRSQADNERRTNTSR